MRDDSIQNIHFVEFQNDVSKPSGDVFASGPGSNVCGDVLIADVGFVILRGPSWLDDSLQGFFPSHRPRRYTSVELTSNWGCTHIVYPNGSYA